MPGGICVCAEFVFELLAEEQAGAMETWLHGGNREAERFGCFFTRQVVDISRDEDDPILCRKPVDRFADCSRGLLTNGFTCGIFAERSHHPLHRPLPVKFWKVVLDVVLSRALALPQLHVNGIERDLVQPGSERGLAAKTVEFGIDK